MVLLSYLKIVCFLGTSQGLQDVPAWVSSFKCPIAGRTDWLLPVEKSTLNWTPSTLDP